MDRTPQLDLPYIMPAQAQKHVTHNEAIRALDAVVQLAVESRTLTTPPPTPADGARHLIASGATGAWTGRDGDVAAYQDGAWAFYTPQPGWMAWIADEDAVRVFTGSTWDTVSGGAGGLSDVNPVAFVGVNATADAANRLAVKSPASLFDHEGTDHRVVINKAATADTASVVFQNAYSGRAEMGLAGDDAFRFKVSATGSSWTEALTVDAATGNVGVKDAAPEFPLEVGGVVSSVAASPAFYLTESDQPTDQKIWRVLCGGGVLSVQTVNDAKTAGQSAIVTTRSGYDVTSVRLLAGGGLGLLLDENQNVSIGHAVPTTRLHVNGALRIGQYAKSGLPSAASAGAGAVAYVTDAAGGPELAFSDGTAWRRASDKAVV